MKHYVYIIDGIAVANPKERLDFKKFGYSYQDGKYDKALAKWKENCIEVENVGKRIVDNWGMEITSCWVWLDKPKWSETTFETVITDGQQVEMEGNIITKIL